MIESAVTIVAALSMFAGQNYKADIAAPMIREGSCGAEVEKTTKKLLDMGFMMERKHSSRCIDPVATSAIYAFQKYKGVAADGVVGPQTSSLLEKTNRVRTEKIPNFKKRGPGRYVFISLEKQLLIFVHKNQAVYTVSISSGQPGYDTPPGIFSVFLKDKMSWSNPYSVWMPWASYFNGGIAMHESASVPPYPASHGCVRLPNGFAKFIYKKTPLGTKVVVA